ncbi:MAG TPA: matrixin family metalloprotease [Fimbriimonas sp.]|nr:matrixin family metalloprotease [Fimbriimonas sp.]
MLAARLPVLIATFAIALPTAPATSTGSNAPVLTEVSNHLSEAQKCFDKGTFDLAAAHADMVLVDENLGVFVKFQSVPENVKSTALKAMGQAFTGWQEALQGSVKFTQVDSEEKADVVIRFKPDVRMGREPVAGFANWKRVIDKDSEGKIVSKFTSDLQIRTMTLSFKPMPMESMRHEMMHEIGHVLGLEDTEGTGDIMGPLDMSRPVAKPREHEAKAVFDIRAQASRIRREAMAQSIKD